MATYTDLHNEVCELVFQHDANTPETATKILAAVRAYVAAGGTL